MRALIFGVAGQDGSYLAEHLLAGGHTVFGATRRAALAIPGVRYVRADLRDQWSLERALLETEPDEVYNLAAVTAPGGRWGSPEPADLADVTAVGVQRLLAAVLAAAPAARVVHASSSAIHDPHRYGLYGVAKRFAHDVVVGYRGRLHVSNAVLYSHTSPRQDPRFVAPTIARTIRALPAGPRFVLTEVGESRDWGWAPDFVRALPLIVRADPGDYEVATGDTHTVGEFVQAAIDVAGVPWDEAVDVQPRTVAPAERAANLTAVTALGWKPEVTFTGMVEKMVASA